MECQRLIGPRTHARMTCFQQVGLERNGLKSGVEHTRNLATPLFSKVRFLSKHRGCLCSGCEEFVVQEHSHVGAAENHDSVLHYRLHRFFALRLALFEFTF